MIWGWHPTGACFPMPSNQQNLQPLGSHVLLNPLPAPQKDNRVVSSLKSWNAVFFVWMDGLSRRRAIC